MARGGPGAPGSRPSSAHLTPLDMRPTQDAADADGPAAPQGCTISSGWLLSCEAGKSLHSKGANPAEVWGPTCKAEAGQSRRGSGAGAPAPPAGGPAGPVPLPAALPLLVSHLPGFLGPGGRSPVSPWPSDLGCSCLCNCEILPEANRRQDQERGRNPGKCELPGLDIPKGSWLHGPARRLRELSTPAGQGRAPPITCADHGAPCSETDQEALTPRAESRPGAQQG